MDGVGGEVFLGFFENAGFGALEIQRTGERGLEKREEGALAVGEGDFAGLDAAFFQGTVRGADDVLHQGEVGEIPPHATELAAIAKDGRGVADYESFRAKNSAGIGVAGYIIDNGARENVALGEEAFLAVLEPIGVREILADQKCGIERLVFGIDAIDRHHAAVLIEDHAERVNSVEADIVVDGFDQGGVDGGISPIRSLHNLVGCEGLDITVTLEKVPLDGVHAVLGEDEHFLGGHFGNGVRLLDGERHEAEQRNQARNGHAEDDSGG